MRKYTIFLKFRLPTILNKRLSLKKKIDILEKWKHESLLLIFTLKREQRLYFENWWAARVPWATEVSSLRHRKFKHPCLLSPPSLWHPLFAFRLPSPWSLKPLITQPLVPSLKPVHTSELSVKEICIFKSQLLAMISRAVSQSPTSEHLPVYNPLLTKTFQRQFHQFKKPGLLFHSQTILGFSEMSPKLIRVRTTFQSLLPYILAIVSFNEKWGQLG